MAARSRRTPNRAEQGGLTAGPGKAASEHPPRDARADEDEDEDDQVAVLEITDELDLHGFQPRDILDVVESYLEAAQQKGLSEVRLIHGRGKGFQRARVQALLERSPRVRSFADAPARRGGWGATIAWLEEA